MKKTLLIFAIFCAAAFFHVRLNAQTITKVFQGGQKGTTNTNAEITHTPLDANHEGLDIIVYDVNGNKLALDSSGRPTVNVNGTVAVSGTVTTTPPSNASTNVAQINGVTPLMGAGNTGTGSPRVTIASDQATIPVSLASVPSHAVTNAGTFAVQATLQANSGVDIGKLTANQTVNVSQINGVTPLMGAGNTGTGSPRVTIASDQATIPVSLASVPSHAVTNAGTFAVQATVAAAATNIAKAEDVASADADVGVPAMAVRKATPANTSGTDGDYEFLQSSAGRLWVSAVIDSALPTGANVIGALSANQSVNVSQINGVTPLMGAGNTGTGSPRVTIASDQAAIPVNATDTPATSGGLSTYHLVSAATTNATNIKASAGQVYGWYIYNSNAAARKLVFHNASGTPTAGASVFFSVMLPPTSAANVHYSSGIAFGTGIAITTVTGLADSDSAAVAANDLVINIFYK